MKQTIKHCFVFLLLGIYTTIYATEEVYQQDTTTVTASRYEQNKDDIIPSITIIDRADILSLQANSILDVLSLQQGLDVARNGGVGTATSVFMRGTNSNHSLVLINGMRVGSAFTGGFAWENIPVSQIERIEIVRGTRVSYYGSDAMGGVINIITRSEENTYARYTFGSFDTHNFDLGFGNSFNDSQYSIVIGSQKTDGFSATNEANLFSYDPDDDGYENQSVNINYSKNTQEGVFNFNFLQANADSDFDTGNSDSKERSTKIAWKNTLFNQWDSEVSFANNYNLLDTKVFGSIFDSNRNSFDWILNKKINNSQVGLGINYRSEKAEFTNLNALVASFSDKRNNLAAFGNWQVSHNNNIFSISGRFDDNSIYGSDFSSDFSWANRLSETSMLNLSVGTAFHAPSISELFSPNFQGTVISPLTGESVFVFSFEGNLNLKPEESINYELGYKTEISDNQNFSANLFYYKIDNLIDFQGPTFKPVNINEASIKGLESAYTYRDKGYVFNINATIQDAKDSLTGSALLRRPDHKLNINLDKTINQISFGSSLRYASKNPDFGIMLDGYIVLDVRSSYRINQNWAVGLKVENALNKDYQIINGFNTSNNAAYFSLEWQQ
ncbi:MAG: TonB-dependent receptor [Marinicellaceae bacterium]